jgi:Mg-chelatase subunit ChlD
LAVLDVALDERGWEMHKELDANRAAIARLDADNPAPGMTDRVRRARNEGEALLKRLRNAPTVDLDTLEIDQEVVRMVPKEVAVKHTLIAFSLVGEGSDSILWVAMADTSNIFAFDDVKFLTGHRVEARAADKGMIARAIDKYYTDPPPDAA